MVYFWIKVDVMVRKHDCGINSIELAISTVLKKKMLQFDCGTHKIKMESQINISNKIKKISFQNCYCELFSKSNTCREIFSFCLWDNQTNWDEMDNTVEYIKWFYVGSNNCKSNCIKQNLT